MLKTWAVFVISIEELSYRQELSGPGRKTSSKLWREKPVAV
jgi:hypothetical protein